MRIPSGTTDRYIYFVAVDSSDLKTRETALSTFTVYYEIANGTATVMTTPTVTESSSANMPGVYTLLIDEGGMTTLTAGHDTAELCLHITQASMAPVTRVIEIYRAKFTEGQAAVMANSAVDADLERIAGAVVSTSTAQLGVNAVQAGATAWGSGAITAASIATGAIDADAIAADAATEIANAVWDTDATGRQTQGTFGQAIGDPAADTNTIYKAVVTDATGATVGVDVVAVKAQTAAIEVDTAEIGAAGAGLTDINLPNQTMDIVGNITGNLSGSVGSVTGAVGSVTGNVGGNVTGSVGSVATGGITAASIADGAIDAATFAADVDAEVRSYLGLATANLDTQLDDIDAEIASIGTASGAAINTDATTDNSGGGITGVTSGTTIVGTPTNTYTATSSVNGSYHTITHSANAIDIVYQFLIGGGTSPVSVTWTGYLTSGNDTITFSVWNHVGAAWESMATQVGQAGTTNVVKNIPLYARHEGTSAAELGKVYVRLHCTAQSLPVLQTDQLYVSYSVTSRSVGYAQGAVWIDTNTGVAGTESFVNGVADNPVLTLADALTIATDNRLRKFEVGNGSALTLASTTANKVFEGHEWTLALGGQNIASSMFIDASVSGTGTGAAAEFETCEIGAVTLAPCFVHRCALGGTVTIGSAGDYFFYDCHSSVAGTSTPVIDMGAAVGATNISLRRWSGGLTFNNIASGDIISLDAVSGGTVTLNGADGNVQVRGMVNVVDNRTGSFTLGTTNNMDARFDTLDTAITTIDDFLDTEVAAIKAKTDQMTFTVANVVDAHIKYVAGEQVTGSGTAGDPWQPV